MVQTFGKRILGGIGAPNSGASKAYAEGVNTGISQRTNRQAMEAVSQDMRLAEQDQQFKIEDREEAKRRRAAAEAAAGAAKARSAALARALAGTVGQAPGVKIPRQQNFGSNVAVGGSIPLLPPASAAAPVPTTPRPRVDVAPTAGLRTPDMNISNIEFVRGTDDRPSRYSTLESRARDRGMTDTPDPPRFRADGAISPTYVRTNSDGDAIRSLAGAAYRPGDFAAQAAQRDLTERQAAIAASGAPLTPREAAFRKQFRRGAGSTNIPALQQYRQELEDQIAAETQARATGDSRWWWQKKDLDKLLAEKQRVDAEIEAVRAQPARVGLQTRGGTAEEGPGSTAAGIAERAAFVGPPVAPTVTIKGPNGDIVVPADTPEGPDRGAVSDRAQMPFGPWLGAPSADADASVVDRVAANPPEQPMPPPNAELYIMEPGRNGRELQQAYNEREELVRQIGIYSEYGEYGEVAKLVEQVKTIDNNLYLLQGAQGIQELEFNSPQRLQMVLSEQLGRNIGIQANDIGGYDLFVDGQLAMQLEAGNGENSLAYWARTRIDTAFAEAEAARAAAYNEKLTDSRFTQANDRARILEEAAAAETKAQRDARREEDKQVLLADLAIVQNYRTEENKVKIDQLRQSLIEDGSLLPDSEIEVRVEGSTMVIYDKVNDTLVQFILQDVADETGNVVGQKFVRVKE